MLKGDEAGKYDVPPLDDRDWERAAERLKMNPTTRYEYLADMARTDAKSLTCADSTGTCTLVRIETSESVREAI
jgi:hypothetical protein